MGLLRPEALDRRRELFAAWEPDQVDLVDTDDNVFEVELFARPVVLVETHTETGEVSMTHHLSPALAASYWAEQEDPFSWVPQALVDVRTGRRFEIRAGGWVVGEEVPR